VSDLIPNELRAIVEFLNEQMENVEVLAVEVRQYVDRSGQHQTLVPRVIGQTQAALRVKGRTSRTTWDESSWLRAFSEARGDREADVAQRLLAWAHGHTPYLDVSFGTGTKDPSARVSLTGAITPFALHRGFTQGRIELQFAGLSKTPPFDADGHRQELRRRLQTIALVEIREDQLDKYPSIPISAVQDVEDFERFIDAMDWVIREVAPDTSSESGSAQQRISALWIFASPIRACA
jgi:hypothetical protein